MKIAEANVLFVLVVLALLSPVAFADGDPATDDVAGLFAYSGVVEKDGVGVSGDLTMSFKVFDGVHAVSETPTWMETQSVSLHAGRFSVLLGECDGQSASTVRCPSGDLDANVGIVQVVQNADDLYLAVVVDDGSGAPVALQNLKRFVPVPYAHLSANAANLDVAGRLRVNGPLEVQAILPRAQNWASLGEGENGAGIYSDEGGYKQLMIVGNRSAGNERQVGIWDDLTVARDTSVARNLSVGGSLSVGGNLTAGSFSTSGMVAGTQIKGRAVGKYASTHGAGPRACILTCRDLGGRMATYDELFSVAAAGGDWCDYVWFTRPSATDMPCKGYPMYSNFTVANQCGRANTGDRPRIEGLWCSYDWNSTESHNCACSLLK